MRKIKRTFIIFTLSTLLLTGCSNYEDIKYTFIYTERYTLTGLDPSLIVGFDEDGKFIKRKQVWGTEHFNLIDANQNLVINNGMMKGYISENWDIKYTKFEESRGVIERNDAFYHNDVLYYIYNDGFSDGKYSTKIEKEGSDVVDINGYQYFHLINGKSLYLAVAPLKAEGDFDKCKLIEINLDDMSIKREQFIDMERYPGNLESISGVPFLVNGNMVLIKPKRHGEGEESEYYLFEINLDDFKVIKQIDVTNQIKEIGHKLHTYFEYKGDAYFISDNNKVMRIDLNSEEIFVETGIEIPKEFDAYRVIYNKDN
ncbi:MAG: hypothetical protein ACK5KQ_00355, partial [Anaerorhabdus sp.]